MGRDGPLALPPNPPSTKPAAIVATSAPPSAHAMMERHMLWRSLAMLPASVESASSSTIRTSPISRNRRFGSFSRQRCSSRRSPVWCAQAGASNRARAPARAPACPTPCRRRTRRARSASRRARSRRPRCRCACRRAARAPAPGSCTPRCRAPPRARPRHRLRRRRRRVHRRSSRRAPSRGRSRAP